MRNVGDLSVADACRYERLEAEIFSRYEKSRRRYDGFDGAFNAFASNEAEEDFAALRARFRLPKISMKARREELAVEADARARQLADSERLLRKHLQEAERYPAPKHTPYPPGYTPTAWVLEVVGNRYSGTNGEYTCTGYDRSCGFWMRLESIRKGTETEMKVGQYTNVSERAIDRTFHVVRKSSG